MKAKNNISGKGWKKDFSVKRVLCRMIEEFIWQMVDENIPLNKRELLMRMRRVISLGIEAIKAENATEKFEYVAWQYAGPRF